VAGAERDDVFSEDALDALWTYSNGIPRILNVLCDTALLFAYGEDVSRVDQALVESVVRSRTAGGLGFGADGSESDAEPFLAAAPGEVPRELEVRLQRLEGRLRDVEAERDRLREQVRATHADQRQLLEAFKLLKRRLDARQPPLSPLGTEVPGSRTQPTLVSVRGRKVGDP
jgi:general secretion pathway protein A